MSKLFDEETVSELRRIFSSLQRNLRDILVVEEVSEHGGRDKCPTCPEAVELARELHWISDGKLTFEILYGIEKARGLRPRYLPAFIYDTKARNIRYYGLPSGQEFAPFIYIHKYISEGVKLRSDLSEELESIETPLHVKVFVTPECPYCPIVVDFLNQAGVINPNLLIDTIEAFEHPYEADKYMVQYVPFIAITRIEDYDIYGARPVETVPGYLPPEDIITVLKRAERKVKQARGK